jgi:hypothetical protein
MGTVMDYQREKPEILEGSKNEVLAITKVDVYAVNRTNADSEKETLLVMVFGKMNDGGPGVFVLADAGEVKKQLRIPHQKLLDQIRGKISATEPVEAEDLPPTPGMDVGLPQAEG